jgi:5-methyltetrahydropteroyltriglutamate--homocysteine methyltransferase
MERAGIDIVTDGEVRRESYSNRFAVALEGIDGDNPAEIIGRTGATTVVPRVVGPIRRRAPVELRDATFLRANTDRPAKITLPGPFTMSMQAKDDHYNDPEAVAMAYAAAVNEELRDLKAAGMDVVQLDEPWMQARPAQAKAFGVKALNRALEGIAGPITVHLCFGYAAVVNDKPTGYSFLPQLADSAATQISIEAAQPKLDLGVLKELGDKQVVLGVLDLGRPTPETAEEVAGLARKALGFVAPERLILAPDCGMKYISRELAFAKLRAMVEGAAILRREIGG